MWLLSDALSGADIVVVGDRGQEYITTASSGQQNRIMIATITFMVLVSFLWLMSVNGQGE